MSRSGEGAASTRHAHYDTLLQMRNTCYSEPQSIDIVKDMHAEMAWVVLGQVVVHVVQPLSPRVHLDAPAVLESRVDALRKGRAPFIVVAVARYNRQHASRVEDLARSLQDLCVQRIVNEALQLPPRLSALTV